MGQVIKYTDNPDFLEFVNREFDLVTAAATLEELCGFAFGSFEDAIRRFEEANQ